MVVHNYTHTHMHYQHTLYSYEQSTPPQFTQTYTQLDDSNKKLIHHHHIYKIINIHRHPRHPRHPPRPTPVDDVENSKNDSHHIVNRDYEAINAANSLVKLSNLPPYDGVVHRPKFFNQNKKPNLSIATDINVSPNKLFAPRNYQIKDDHTKSIVPGAIKILKRGCIDNPPSLDCDVSGKIIATPIRMSQLTNQLDNDLGNQMDNSPIQSNKINDGAYLYYFNDSRLRSRVKSSHPHFSLLELNNYLQNSWNKMNEEEKQPWVSQQQQLSYSEYIKSGPEIGSKSIVANSCDNLELISGGESCINMHISRWSKSSYSNKELINKQVYGDAGREGRVIGTYKRSGKQLRFRVQWNDGERQLYYKKAIIEMLNSY